METLHGLFCTVVFQEVIIAGNAHTAVLRCSDCSGTGEATSQRGFTPREIATVLAGLRFLQDHLYAAETGCDHREEIRSMPHFLDEQPLEVLEIDQLCERINFDFGGK